jgi:hypothetical protein
MPIKSEIAKEENEAQHSNFALMDPSLIIAGQTTVLSDLRNLSVVLGDGVNANLMEPTQRGNRCNKIDKQLECLGKHVLMYFHVILS